MTKLTSVTLGLVALGLVFTTCKARNNSELRATPKDAGRSGQSVTNATPSGRGHSETMSAAARSQGHHHHWGYESQIIIPPAKWATVWPDCAEGSEASRQSPTNIEFDANARKFLKEIATVASLPEVKLRSLTTRQKINPMPLRNVNALAYPGSLTTPPCTNNVAWFVKPRSVQLEESLLAGLKLAMGFDNARPVVRSLRL